MLHLLPVAAPETRPGPYAEAIARLASVRHALRLVDGDGGGPAADFGDDEALGCAWDDAGAARQRLFDSRSARMVRGTMAGVEALADAHSGVGEPHAEATRELVDQIRGELADVAGVILA